MTVSTDTLRSVASKFGKDFQVAKEPSDSFLGHVYILDDAYVLKGRPSTPEQREQIYRENVLLPLMKEKVPFALPLLLATEDGHPFVEAEERLWTLAHFIPGHPMGKWQDTPINGDVRVKTVFATLKTLHDRTLNMPVHDHTDLDAFIRERRSQLERLKHLLSAHVQTRIDQALNRLHEARATLSPDELCFIHGDFHTGNIIVNDGGEIVGFIDCDYSRIGHRFEDLAFTTQRCMNDYLVPQFAFNNDQFHQFLEWYGIRREEHSLFTEYLLLASLLSVWNFFSASGTPNQEFYLHYHLTMIHDLAVRFGSEHDKAAPVQTGPVKFPVDLSEKYLALAAELQIHPKDIDERFVRGSGHGGQKMNKTSSCVELHHAPSATDVRVQEYREQHKNRMEAYKRLIQKVEEKTKGKESSKAKEVFKIRKQKARRGRKAKEKMLKDKKIRGEVKENRRRAD